MQSRHVRDEVQRDQAPAIDLAHLVQTPPDQIRFDPEIERNPVSYTHLTLPTNREV